MSDIAIKVDKLSKRYRIGLNEELPDTFVGAATNFIRKPFKNLRQLRRLTRFSSNNDNLEDVIWALKDVSFEVERGEVVGIIGRNGAGKSTLLKILSQITHPTSGRVELDGRVSSLLEVGTGFHPELTGRENIYLNGAILGMTKAEIDRKFEEIVDFSGVEKFIDTPVKRYSSGMRVRLAFSVAAHLEPEILLVDEVLAVGDAEFQKKCLGKIGKVAQEGRTVLFVSHNIGAISELCQRTILLASGEKIHDGETQIIVADYLFTNITKGYIDLSDWSGDRTGEGPMRIKYLVSLNKNKEVKSVFSYGEPILFEIGIHAEIGKTFCIGLSIRNSMGQVIMHFMNTDDDMILRMPSNDAKTLVYLPKNILRDGDYHVTVFLADQYKFLNDRVGNCISFSVESSTHGNFGSLGLVRVPVEWDIIEIGHT